MKCPSLTHLSSALLWKNMWWGKGKMEVHVCPNLRNLNVNFQELHVMWELVVIGQTQDSGLSTHKSPILCFNPAKTIRKWTIYTCYLLCFKSPFCCSFHHIELHNPLNFKKMLNYRLITRVVIWLWYDFIHSLVKFTVMQRPKTVHMIIALMTSYA